MNGAKVHRSSLVNFLVKSSSLKLSVIFILVFPSTALLGRGLLDPPRNPKVSCATIPQKSNGIFYFCNNAPKVIGIMRRLLTLVGYSLTGLEEEHFRFVDEDRAVNAIEKCLNDIEFDGHPVATHDGLALAVRQNAHRQRIVTLEVILGHGLERIQKLLVAEVLVNLDVVAQHAEHFSQIVSVHIRAKTVFHFLPC